MKKKRPHNNNARSEERERPGGLERDWGGRGAGPLGQFYSLHVALQLILIRVDYLARRTKVSPWGPERPKFINKIFQSVRSKVPTDSCFYAARTYIITIKRIIA